MNSLTEEIGNYLTEIGSFPLLSREEEWALGKRILNGDLKARNQLVESNLRFGFFISKGYFRMKFADPLEIIGAGNEGLLTAANKFDPEKNVKFITHAGDWVINYIQRFFSEMRYSVRVPKEEYRLRQNAPKAETYLKNILGRQPTEDEVAVYLIGTRKFVGSPENVRRILRWDGMPEVSLDKKIGDEISGTSLLDLMVGSDGTEVLDSLEKRSLTIVLDNLLNQLDEKERFVLIAYGCGFANFTELGKVLGVSRGTPPNIYRKAKKKVIGLARENPAFEGLGMDYLLEQ